MIGALALLVPVYPAGGQHAEKELQIRAAFLLNFVKFTQWPDEAFDREEDPLVLCALGVDPFGRVLEQTFNGKRIHDRAIELKRIELPQRREFDSAAQYEQALQQMMDKAASSHVVYLNIDDVRMRRWVLEHLEPTRTLIVGHEREYAERGTHLALHRAGENMVFYANVSVIRQSELSVSSKLLKLARIVDQPQERDSR